MRQDLARLLQRFSRPIAAELPFFVAAVVLIFGSNFSSFVSVVVNLCFTVLWAYAFTVVFAYKRCKALKIIGFILLLIPFIVEVFSQLCLGICISPTLLTILAETNAEEVKSFATTFVAKPETVESLAIAVLVVIVYALFERKWALRRESARLSTAVASAFFVITLAGTVPTVELIRLFGTKDTDEITAWFSENQTSTTITNIAQSAWTLHISGRETQSMIAKNMSLGDARIVSADDTLDVVLVIGESFIRKHSSLYGYALRTNPLLEREQRANRLICFSDASSVSNTTTSAIRNMLCTNSLSDGTAWHKSVYAPAVIRHAGYDVLYWNNQMDASGNIWAFALNSLTYSDAIKQMSYTACNDTIFSYDEELIDHYEKHAPRDLKPHTFTIFHLTGQHFNPARRYPAEFQHFTADSIQRNEPWMTDRMRRKIAEYDNATLYNDFVISQIIDIYRNRNAVLVYLSDHGDEVFDYRPKNARPPLEKGLEREYAEYILGVPFMIWASDTYKCSHPEKWAAVEEASHKPLTTDNLPHVLFDLAEIETEEYSAEHDVLSPDYRYAPIDIVSIAQH